MALERACTPPEIVTLGEFAMDPDQRHGQIRCVCVKDHELQYGATKKLEAI